MVPLIWLKGHLSNSNLLFNLHESLLYCKIYVCNFFNGTPAPEVSSSPPASSSPRQQTQPQVLQWSQCSLPVNSRGVTHCYVSVAQYIRTRNSWIQTSLETF